MSAPQAQVPMRPASPAIVRLQTREAIFRQCLANVDADAFAVAALWYRRWLERLDEDARIVATMLRGVRP